MLLGFDPGSLMLFSGWDRRKVGEWDQQSWEQPGRTTRAPWGCPHAGTTGPGGGEGILERVLHGDMHHMLLNKQLSPALREGAATAPKNSIACWQDFILIIFSTQNLCSNL